MEREGKGGKGELPLNVVIETEKVVTVSSEEVKTVRSGKVFKLNQSCRPFISYGLHKLIHNLKVFLQDRYWLKMELKDLDISAGL